MTAVLCAPALSAGAQSLQAYAKPGATSEKSGDSTGSATPVVITAASVMTSGAPRSYQVVSVPVPDALLQANHIEVVIDPRGDFQILGSRTRSIDMAPGRGRITVTIGVPAAAIAGKATAAEVRFYASGSPTMVVPVEIDVTLVRSIVLRPPTSELTAQAGNDVILPFEIANTGNAIEHIATDLELPSGWASRDLHQSGLEISPGETIKQRVRLKVPALSATGSSFVHLALISGGDTLASQTMTVEVFNSSSIGREAGPLITSSIAGATDENGRANRLLTLNATGALYDSVRVDARFSQGSVLGGAASNAFSHLGSYQSSASVMLSAPSGQLSLGNT
ncbi:MAG TPA: NEW3 domain-containing protein, partial [Gemmatimonadaceae bacterium]